MGYSVSEICRATGANPYSFQPADGKTEKPVVETLLIDSRSLIDPAGAMFVALSSAKNDGHKFINDLYRKGVRIFMVNAAYKPKQEQTDACYLGVPDTLSALQQLVAWHRSRFNIPVVAITGSNGKTIVKEWLYQLLSPDKNIVRSPGSYNSQVGVPLSVWAMDHSHELAIFEAGISQAGEMAKLEPIIKPTIGIITNIGEAHGINFTGLSQKAKEKLKLFAHARTLIYCKDHKEIDDALTGAKPAISGINLYTWSRVKDADIRITETTPYGNGASIRAFLRETKQEISFTIPFKDDASIENSIHCFAYMVHSGYSTATIEERMGALLPVAMRLEMIKGINHCTIINDVYNSDLNSLSVALEFLDRQKQHTRKTVILSDIAQSSGTEKELYSKVAEIIKAKKPDRLIAIGNTISHYAGLFDTPEKHFFAATAEFLAKAGSFGFRDETILVKGARSFEFENISRLLQNKTHETELLIDLNALIHNLNYFKSITRPGTKVMAMVKAFSYGSGSFEIANTLQYHGADYLAVAYADEGVELRTAGITLPIMVMNPEQGGAYSLLQNNLEPEIYNFRTLGFITEAIKRHAPARALPVHIKLDTGMHRLGFAEADMERLISVLNENPHVKVKSVFSHLAASDSDKHRQFTLGQIERYTAMSDKIIRSLGYPVIRHILNSAGIVRFPEAHFDMVRLGIGLYGIGVNEQEQLKLENVSTLKTTISQINRLKKGETVGYNRRETLQRDSVIATVAIGYADGYGRELGNGKGSMLVHGIAAPVVGDVCMDMCMIDITGIDAAEGDEAIIFNTTASLRQMAAGMNTIPYEALTCLSPRVKRIYIQQ
ncbi:MAG: bifunctional UDP-N-acetylmuramoyl-tripeptide:D-alanyl-D-alanine ligase/alanine racemase [Bacteroidia bacterium]|nr:bifunctional UDP-N-acetylmuramoyl-tripeptide:D-alanyl-D-alanine ligase/alanine racemase [Bacteroidia bacterium]